MSVGWCDDEGEGGGGLVGVCAELAGDAAVAGAAQQAEGGVAQERHHGGAGAGVGQAGVLAEDHILRVVQAILDGPVAALERENAELAARANAAIATAQDRVYWLDRWGLDLNALMRRRGAAEFRAAIRAMRAVVRRLQKIKRRLAG